MITGSLARTRKVSVVIPFHSRVDWLAEAVESAFDQTYQNLEIIVVNDGSKEDVSEFIEKYRGSLTYVLKENGGPASARNMGIDRATGEYIAFLDSDDIWCREKIERQVELMNKTRAIWSHTSYSSFRDSSQGRTYSKVDVSRFQGNVFPKCLIFCPIATPCVMVKTSYLKSNIAARFAEEMRYGQDYYMWVQLARRNALEVVPDTLTKVRLRGTNAASRARVQLRVRAYFWKHIRENRAFYFTEGEAYYIMRSGLAVCHYANFIAERLEQKRIFNETLLENFARILYLFPYAVFKIYYNTVWKNK